MAHVRHDRVTPGTEFEIDVRGRRAKAKVVPMPFYKRTRRGALARGRRMYPTDLKYTKDHGWFESPAPKHESGLRTTRRSSWATWCISELPEVGRPVKKGEVFGTIESVKAVSGLLSGERRGNPGQHVADRKARIGEQGSAQRLDDRREGRRSGEAADL